MTNNKENSELEFTKLTNKMNRIIPNGLSEITLILLLIEYIGQNYPFTDPSAEEAKKQENLEQEIISYIEKLTAEEKNAIEPLINAFKMAKFMTELKIT